MSYKWELPEGDDVAIATQPYHEILAKLERPRHRQMLEMLIEHIRCVTVGDLDGVMDTLVADPHFFSYGPNGDTGSKGYDATRAKYSKMGSGVSSKNRSVEINRYVIDDDALALEMTDTRLMPWQVAKQQGIPIGAAEGYYAVRRHFAFFIPFDEEGRERGENSYGFGWPPHATDVEPVPPQDLSPEYRELLDAMVTD